MTAYLAAALVSPVTINTADLAKHVREPELHHSKGLSVHTAIKANLYVALLWNQTHFYLMPAPDQRGMKVIVFPAVLLSIILRGLGYE